MLGCLVSSLVVTWLLCQSVNYLVSQLARWLFIYLVSRSVFRLMAWYLSFWGRWVWRDGDRNMMAVFSSFSFFFFLPIIFTEVAWCGVLSHLESTECRHLPNFGKLISGYKASHSWKYNFSLKIVIFIKSQKDNYWKNNTQLSAKNLVTSWRFVPREIWRLVVW